MRWSRHWNWRTTFLGDLSVQLREDGRIGIAIIGCLGRMGQFVQAGAGGKDLLFGRAATLRTIR